MNASLSSSVSAGFFFSMSSVFLIPKYRASFSILSIRGMYFPLHQYVTVVALTPKYSAMSALVFLFLAK